MTEARLIVENFVDSMTHLMELLIKETSILNDKDFDGLESIQSRKLQLSRVYEDAQAFCTVRFCFEKLPDKSFETCPG